MLVICSVTDTLNTNFYETTFGGMPGSFTSSQINACVVGIGVLGSRFIVSSEGLGLHKMLPHRGVEPGTSYMPGKRCTTRLQLKDILCKGDGIDVLTLEVCWVDRQTNIQTQSFVVKTQCNQPTLCIGYMYEYIHNCHIFM